ncbi:hypothetical protein [Sessilibacter corallicola]|uniref:Uncharacterized protein n=1 Tax=Sessilibacter corallicola TaxID=2904075 RepID=A0ABQ0A9M0_9GAMM
MDTVNHIDSSHHNSPQKISLESLNDEAIKTLINEGYKLLDRRKREREKSIKEQIKALAATEGIKVSFQEPANKRGNKTRG